VLSQASELQSNLESKDRELEEQKLQFQKKEEENKLCL
jgi:hypothetical protein